MGLVLHSDVYLASICDPSNGHDDLFIPKHLGLGEKSHKFPTNEDVDQK